jgi:signal transduction histidine kinase
VQGFQNLVANAIKFTPPDRAPRIRIESEPDGPEWRISVADNGIGIDPAQSERIFGMFARLHAQDQYPGTGIGLALCARIIERHRGRIWAQSQPGQGSVFSFTLPAAGP